ncbi:MAG TPA: hypothetical protein VMH40_07360, partial [Myxococcaceae bacterium]|nr:hypothetical protein [Myxococcaceae bacterium]
VAPTCREGDNTPCSPFANPDAGIATGSGYNPNFPITCRADIGEFFIFGPPPYCLSPNPDGSCDPANVDPDTRQIGICYLPEGATFPALNP